MFVLHHPCVASHSQSILPQIAGTAGAEQPGEGVGIGSSRKRPGSSLKPTGATPDLGGQDKKKGAASSEDVKPSRQGWSLLKKNKGWSRTDKLIAP
jgi:hypothetical protein